MGNIKTKIENIKKDQSEMKNTLQEISSGEDKAENQIRDLEDKEAENTQSECHEE